MDKGPYSLHAQSPEYTIKNHENYEDEMIPLKLNFLKFRDASLNKAKIEALCKKPQSESFSREFKLQLASYLGLLWMSTLVHFIGRLLIFSDHRQDERVFALHAICSVCLFLISLFLSIAIRRKSSFFRHHQTVLAVKTALFITYFILADDLVHSDRALVNNTLLVYLLLFSLSSALFNSFVHMFWLSLYTLLLFSVVHILSQPLPWTNLAIFLLSLQKLLSDCYLITYRTNQLFYRHHIETLEERKKEKDDHVDYESDLGKLMKSCSFITDTLKWLRKIMLDLGIKSEINKSLKHIRHITRILPIKLKFSVNLKDQKHLDEDEKIFISENFIEDVQLAAMVSSSLSNTIDPSKFMSEIKDNSEEIVQCFLKKFGKDWGFDILFLSKITPDLIQVAGRCLSETFDLARVLKVHISVVNNFFDALDYGYFSMPYHNSAHATEVAHSVLFGLFNSQISARMSMIDLYSMLVAAFAHDLGHKGVTNRYLVNTSDDLAIRYNDQSIQENMHCYLLFKILKKKAYNIFAVVNPQEYRNIRKMIIEMILSTDMSKHFEIFERFKARTEVSRDIDLENYADKMLVYCMLLKCADVGHTAKPLEIHQAWTFKAVEEFYNQGDLERESGLSISMYCDRNNTDLAKSQYGFIKNIAYPLFRSLSLYLNSSTFNEVCILQLRQNKKFWKTGGGNRRNTYTHKIDTVSPINEGPRRNSVQDNYKGIKKVGEVFIYDRNTI